MPIEPIRTGDKVARDDGRATPPWLEWCGSVFNALFGWKRSYTKLATIDFGNIAAQSQLTSTAAVPGARQGDAVLVTAKTQVNGLGVFGFVSGNDVVTVVRFNYSAGAIDPASDDFRILVFQQ